MWKDEQIDTVIFLKTSFAGEVSIMMKTLPIPYFS